VERLYRPLAPQRHPQERARVGRCHGWLATSVASSHSVAVAELVSSGTLARFASAGQSAPAEDLLKGLVTLEITGTLRRELTELEQGDR
jgi:hypothetical protein